MSVTSGQAGRGWRIAVLAALGVICAGSKAQAALYYWSYDELRHYRSPVFPQRHPSIRHRGAKATSMPQREAAKPRGPLIIAISIQKQRLKLYDANGLFAESSVSTGMKGHRTPMGIFSIIQKQKFHRSNIYSDAPMPYMQRITWSGVAMHGGALPGYPASHGCIRMPMSFAVKMWRWTKLGARIVITPGETGPVSFSHPLLPTHAIAPELTAAIGSAPKALVAADVTAQAGAIKPASQPIGEPRPSLKDNISADLGRVHDQAAGADSATDERSNGASTTSSDAGLDATRPIPTTSPRKFPEAHQRRGRIAVLISRKDSKLYVRQNFAPLFEAPVTIAADDRPLGTHVFTAEADKDNRDLLHWSVLSLPVPSRYARDPSGSHKRQLKGVREVKAIVLPDDPAEALNRLVIPVEAMARIAEALSNGGSIIVSDQGIRGGETGQGTDFIVSLH
jgi:hypothetical protein